MTGMTRFGRALTELQIRIPCLRNKRDVSKNLTLKYDQKRIRREVNGLARGLVGDYADTYKFPDGRIRVRHNCFALPHL